MKYLIIVSCIELRNNENVALFRRHLYIDFLSATVEFVSDVFDKQSCAFAVYY